MTIGTIILIIIKNWQNQKTVKPQKRKKFSKKTKDAVLKDQNNFCRTCLQYLEVAEFDHIDGDRSDNSRFNCQALCPNCHAKKTKRIYRKHKPKCNMI